MTTQQPDNAIRVDAMLIAASLAGLFALLAQREPCIGNIGMLQSGILFVMMAHRQGMRGRLRPLLWMLVCGTTLLAVMASL